MLESPEIRSLKESLEDLYNEHSEKDQLARWSLIEEGAIAEMDIDRDVLRDHVSELIRRREFVILDARSSDESTMDGPPGYENRSYVKLSFRSSQGE